jgi:hypothetical protein
MSLARCNVLALKWPLTRQVGEDGFGAVVAAPPHLVGAHPAPTTCDRGALLVRRSGLRRVGWRRAS